MKLLPLIMMTSVTMLASMQVNAETTDLSAYNCGAQNIQIGMSSQQLKASCSEQPKYISKHERPALKKEKEQTGKAFDHFEKWLYKTAGQNATHVLIKNGKVIRIFTNTTRTASQ